jgi:hypothetical protein
MTPDELANLAQLRAGGEMAQRVDSPRDANILLHSA